MSIQRHIFIFNVHIIRIRWKRILFHNLPILFCLIYPVTFYLFAIIFCPCDGSPWDYTKNGCGMIGCYLAYDEVLSTYDWLENSAFLMITDMLTNMVLIIRVVREKRRHQRISWRQQRKLVVQLLYISSLYIIGWGPSVIVGVVQMFFSPSFLADIQSDYFLDFLYIICLLLPWMSLGLLPEMKQWIKELYRGRQRRNIVRIMPPHHA